MLCERNLDDSGNFTVRGCFPLIWKDSTTHMLYDLISYLKNRLLMFLFGNFNVHHKDSLTYSDGSDRPGELCYNFSTWNDLTQLVNFPTQIRTVTLTVMLFFIYLFLLMLVFVLQRLSPHWEILIMLLSQFAVTFHEIHYGVLCFIA